MTPSPFEARFARTTYSAHSRVSGNPEPESLSFHVALGPRVRGDERNDHTATFARPYSAGIGVAGAVGVVTACDGVDGPLSGRSSSEIRNAIPNDITSAQVRNTKRNA